MSRHSIPSKDPQITVVLGWDAPLQTYFLQVDREPADEDDDPESILDEGNRYQQHPTLDKLLVLLAAYAIVPEATWLQLANDKATSTTPSALQMAIIADLSHLELEGNETHSRSADTTIATFPRCQHPYEGAVICGDVATHGAPGLPPRLCASYVADDDANYVRVMPVNR